MRLHTFRTAVLVFVPLERNLNKQQVRKGYFITRIVVYGGVTRGRGCLQWSQPRAAAGFSLASAASARRSRSLSCDFTKIKKKKKKNTNVTNYHNDDC